MNFLGNTSHFSFFRDHHLPRGIENKASALSLNCVHKIRKIESHRPSSKMLVSMLRQPLCPLSPLTKGGQLPEQLCGVPYCVMCT